MHIYLSSLLFLAVSYCVAEKPLCQSSQIPPIRVRGLDVTDVHAEPVKNFTDWRPRHPKLPIESGIPIDFCNVTVTFTHPGMNDNIHVYVLLPSDTKNWNGRLLGEGGAGWAAGDKASLHPPVALGYATAITDAGHSLYSKIDAILDPIEWALLSPGNIDWNMLQEFSSRAVDDLPKVAKQVVKGFYGTSPHHSYWHGCSTGGRQGLMSAQRYPDNWDGILAIAPSNNFATFLVTEHWPQLVMQQQGYWPSQCEFAAIQQAALEACDELDGVKDGLIGAPGLCTFDATNAIGMTYKCDKVKGKVTADAAKIANRIWEGPRRNGKNEWFGSLHEMPFAGTGKGEFSGLSMTSCDEKGRGCKPIYWLVSMTWIKLFLAKDPDFDVSTMTEDDFWRFLHQSRQEYSSIISADDPDISEFKAAGGKMILWHGFADQLIFANGSTNYYQEVLKRDPHADEYFRYFEMPGLFHCSGGPGAYPLHALEALQEWVEKDVAPEQLEGRLNTQDGTTKERIHCPYPRVPAFKGGNPDKKGSYECANSFDSYKHLWNNEHTEL